MAKKSRKKSEEAALGFEQAMEQLESLIERIESGEIGLEASIHEYERGTRLVARCREVLDAAELKIEQIDAATLESDSSGEGSADDVRSDADGDDEPAPF
ncbi:MAG: exodeoxyribonuclease VII small subunit [Planctomycetota bacterium]